MEKHFVIPIRKGLTPREGWEIANMVREVMGALCIDYAFTYGGSHDGGEHFSLVEMHKDAKINPSRYSCTMFYNDDGWVDVKYEDKLVLGSLVISSVHSDKEAKHSHRVKKITIDNNTRMVYVESIP